MPRTGRRPGAPGTRQLILDTAAHEFGRHGFDGATIRSIAGRAGVDPALVHHYFGTKATLFAASVRLPTGVTELLPQLLAAGTEGLGDQLVRLFCTVWDAEGDDSPFFAVFRGALTHEQSAELLREVVVREILGRIAAAVEAPGDPMLRAALAGSQLVGLGMLRYLVRLEPLASAPVDDVVAAIGPTVQRYLTG